MQEKILWDIITTAMVIVFCSGLLQALMKYAKRYWRALRSGCIVEGTVLSNEESEQESKLYAPVIAYETEDGEMIRSKSNLSTGRKKEPGTKVRIMYDPQKPSAFFYAGDHLVPWIMILASLISITAVISSTGRIIRLVGELNNW